MPQDRVFAADDAVRLLRRNRALAADDAVRLLRRSGHTIVMPVTGSSMQPLLQDGDTVRVRTGGLPRVGDIVVAKTAAGLVIHRVVQLHGKRVVLCGDNVSRCDDPVACEQIVGRVVVAESAPFCRFDRGAAWAVGRAAAVCARARHHGGNHLKHPRSARITGGHLRVVDALMPRAPAVDLQTVHLASTGVGDADASTDTFEQPLLHQHIDWDHVAARALLGQIGPLTYVGARRLGRRALLPDRCLQPLRRQLFSNIARTHRVMYILDATLAQLDDVGVTAMAHKGVALAATVYHDPAMRIMGDLDLSVRDEDRIRAARATRQVREALSRANPDRRSPSGFHVELDGQAHHDLDPSRFGTGRWTTHALDWDGIWSRALPATVGSRSVLVPCSTDLVLTLISNSIRRSFTPVRLIVDIAHTIDRHDVHIDWHLLASELRRSRLDRRSWIALQLAVTWCGATVPVELLEPPPDLRTSIYERTMLDWKLRRPFARLPTRVLWAGSWRAAADSVGSLGAGRLRHWARQTLPNNSRQIC